MKNINLIIFDLDGTLVDSREDIANAVNFTLREVGLKEKNLQEISSYIGLGMEDLMKKSLGEREDALLKKAISIFEEYYKDHLGDNSVLYPGVKDVLEYFKNERKVIITNRNYQFAVSALRTLEVYDYFEDIIGGDDIGCMKPSSCPLDKIIHRLNIDKDQFQHSAKTLKNIIKSIK